MQWLPAIAASEELLCGSQKPVFTVICTPFQNHSRNHKEAWCDMCATPVSKSLHKHSVTGAVIPLKQPRQFPDHSHPGHLRG